MTVAMTLFPRRKTVSMKPRKILFGLVIVLAAVLLSSCGVPNSSWPGLATDGEVAYLAAGKYVHAIRLSDKQELWRYENGNLSFNAQPGIAEDGTVIVGSVVGAGGNKPTLVALDGSTTPPQEKWVFTQAKGNWVAPPLILNDKVFAPNSDGTLYVLDLSDGFETKAALAEIKLGGALWAQPVSDGTLVYVTSMDHHLHAIDLDTYEHAWPAIDLGGAAPGSPLIGADGYLYVGSFASEVIKIDPATGKVESFATAQDWVWGGPVLDGETIFFSDLSGYLYAVDAASGAQAWQQKPNEAIVGSPLMLADVVVITTESGPLYAFYRDGTPVCQREAGGQIYTAPGAGSDLILVAPMDTDFLLAAYDANGGQAWTFALEE